jgi:hypothetical protein
MATLQEGSKKGDDDRNVDAKQFVGGSLDRRPI